MKSAITLLSTALFATSLGLFMRAPAAPAAPAASGGEPYIGEIMMFAGTFAPRGWALCDGSLLDISSHSLLYSILGTTYGGDGRETFGLPDLRGRAPVGTGSGEGLYTYRLGSKGGTESTTLTIAQMPRHSHQTLRHGGEAGEYADEGRYLTGVADLRVSETEAALDEEEMGHNGYGKPHNNLSPFLVVNYVIATDGTFPMRD